MLCRTNSVNEIFSKSYHENIFSCFRIFLDVYLAHNLLNPSKGDIVCNISQLWIMKWQMFSSVHTFTNLNHSCILYVKLPVDYYNLKAKNILNLSCFMRLLHKHVGFENFTVQMRYANILKYIFNEFIITKLIH